MVVSRFYPFHPERVLFVGVALLIGGAVLWILLVMHFFQTSKIIQVSVSSKETKSIIQEKKGVSSFSSLFQTSFLPLPLPQIASELSFSFHPTQPSKARGALPCAGFDGTSCREDALLDLLTVLKNNDSSHQENEIESTRWNAGKINEKLDIHGGRKVDISVHCKKSKQSKRIVVPCRIDLQYLDSGKVGFAANQSSFWLDLSQHAQGGIECIVHLETPFSELIEVERFIVCPQLSPIRSAHEFPEASPFRILGEARWLGHNVVIERLMKDGMVYFFEMGDGLHHQLSQLRENQWFVWNGTHWKESMTEEKNCPVARVESMDGKNLILEAWDGDQHVRLLFSSSPIAAFRQRTDELLNSIRIRSEKQISCMLEKQCLILRCGDWVLKSDGKWKVLRNNEEKKAYQSGRLNGELFVFEKIEKRQGQNVVSGSLFNTERNQLIPIESVASKSFVRKGKEEQQMRGPIK